jgi:hypothetical protein
MPAPAPPIAGASERGREARRLRREGGIFTGVGIGLFTGGVVLGVIALDIKQGDRATMQPGGTVVTEQVYGTSNWAELVGAVVLMGSGILFAIAGAQRLARARALESF